MILAQDQVFRAQGKDYLVIQWTKSGEGCAAYLGSHRSHTRELLGVFTSRAELQAGKAFTLDDGSSLRVSASGTDLQATREGLPLPSMAVPEQEVMWQSVHDRLGVIPFRNVSIAVNLMRTTSFLNILAVVAIAASFFWYHLGLIVLLQHFGIFISLEIMFALAYVVLAPFIARYSLAALLLAAGVFLVDGVLFLYAWGTLAQARVANTTLMSIYGVLVTRAIWIAIFRFVILTGLLSSVKSMFTIRKACREVQAEAGAFRGRLLCFQM